MDPSYRCHPRRDRGVLPNRATNNHSCSLLIWRVIRCPVGSTAFLSIAYRPVATQTLCQLAGAQVTYPCSFVPQSAWVEPCTYPGWHCGISGRISEQKIFLKINTQKFVYIKKKDYFCIHK